MQTDPNPRYLILRCHPRDTLPLSLLHPTLYCPTTSVPIRRGPARTRSHVVLPVLPSFLFLSENIHSLPRSPKLRPMQRPHEHPSHPHLFSQQNPLPPTVPRQPPHSYAYCFLSEISVMISHSIYLTTHNSHDLCLGSKAEVTAGLFCGVVGTVVQIRTNGDISLKVQQHLGWQFSTCIVNASVLRSL
jgi:hypothetical protein